MKMISIKKWKDSGEYFTFIAIYSYSNLKWTKLFFTFLIISSNFLEQAYPLCDTCEQATQKTINEKDAKLIGDLVNYKLKSSQKNKSVINLLLYT